MKLNINGKEIEIDNKKLLDSDGKVVESFEVKTDFIIRTSKEEETFTKNIKLINNNAAIEIGRKEMLTGMGIEVSGQHKTLDTAITAFNEKVSTGIADGIKDANIEPNDKIIGLKKDNDGLRGRITELEGFNTKLTGEFGDYKETQSRRAELSALIPDNVINDRKVSLMILESNIKTARDDNGVMFGVKPDGQPMKDSNMTNLPMKDVVSQFYDDNQNLLKKPTGGGGGGDSHSKGDKQDLASFNKEMQGLNHPVNSPEYIKIRDERIKADILEF